MFILPWLHEKTVSSAGTVAHRFHLFLEKGGTQLIPCKETEVESFCQENELFPLERFRKDSVEFVKLDKTKLNMGQFYSFHEENTADLEVWRTFLWIGANETEDPWNTNKLFREQFLSKIRISELLETILRRSAIEE